MGYKVKYLCKDLETAYELDSTIDAIIACHDNVLDYLMKEDITLANELIMETQIKNIHKLYNLFIDGKVSK